MKSVMRAAGAVVLASVVGCAVTATGTATTGTDAGSDRGSANGDISTDASISDAANLCWQPQLLFPETRTILSAPRPRLGWLGASGAPAYRARICRDRACNDVVAEERVLGTRWQPSADLAAGIYFWTVFRTDRVECESRQTRQFRVRARSNPSTTERDVAFSDSADIDGDGLADLVISRANGTLDVVRGDRELSARATTLRFQQPVERLSNLGYSQLTTADVDGDGIQDIVQATVDPTRWPAESNATVEVVFGAPDVSAPHEVARMAEIRQVGAIVENFRGRDLDQDGAEDILIWAAVPRSNEASRVYVLWGARDRRTFSTTILVGQPPEDLVFGAGLASLDENADGATDILFTGARGPVVIHGPVSAGNVLRFVSVPRVSGLAHARGTECDIDGDSVADPLIRSLNAAESVLLSGNRQTPPLSLPIEASIANETPCAKLSQGRTDEVLSIVSPRNVRQVVFLDGRIVATDTDLWQGTDLVPGGDIMTGDMDGDGWPEVLVAETTRGLTPSTFVLATLRGGVLSPLRRLDLGRNQARWL